MKNLQKRSLLSYIFNFNRRSNTSPLSAKSETTISALAAPKGLMCEFLTSKAIYEHQEDKSEFGLDNDFQVQDENQIARIRALYPRFSWIVGDISSGAIQSAYQILVADSREKIDRNEGNLWNCGKVYSSQSLHVPYGGRRLKPLSICYWKVRTWNAENEVSAYSEPEIFYRDKEEGISYYPLVKRKVAPVLIQRKKVDCTFIDFNKAAFGSLSLKLSSAIEGQKVEVYLGEVLEGPQKIHCEPGGARRYRKIDLLLKKGTHTYTLKIPHDARNTRKKAIKMPAYIGEVMPFRYCEIINYIDEISTEDVWQIAINYPFDDDASDFHSSDPVLNDVWELCKYTIKATSFTGIYVDGDRERVPYESDAYINQLGHYATDREFTMARRSIEYLLTHATWPTEWILHSIFMAHADYMYTGDLSLVKKYYKLLTNKTLMALARPDGLISTRTGKATRQVERSVKYDASQFKRKQLADIVDWPHGGSLGLKDEDKGETDGFEFCDINTVVNAFHYRTLVLMGRMAEGLGKYKDAIFFKRRAEKVKDAINEKLLNTQGGLYIDGEGSQHSSLHANMFPLAFGVVPPEYINSVVSFIKSRGMACSVYGAQYLLEGLYRVGEEYFASELLTSKEERSWAHMIYDVGTTMTLEAWDDRFKPNQDWNHAWGTAPANIIPRFLMGIRPLEPGFSKVLIQPQPGHIREAAIRLPTIRGAIHAAFEKTAEEFRLKISIPANMKARAELPLPATASFHLSLNKGSVPVKSDGKCVVLEDLGSGQHSIVLKY